jgi:hypothetical protein
MATAKKPAGPTFPKTIGASIDLLYTLRATRIEKERLIEAEKATESALKEHIMANFAATELDGAKGKLATASIKETTNANIVDWEKYLKWMLKKKDYALVQKRVGITALREHWDNGETVDGVEQIVVKELSLTKAGGR